MVEISEKTFEERVVEIRRKSGTSRPAAAERAKREMLDEIHQMLMRQHGILRSLVLSGGGVWFSVPEDGVLEPEDNDA